jgi:hypothetical protein
VKDLSFKSAMPLGEVALQEKESASSNDIGRRGDAKAALPLRNKHLKKHEIINFYLSN